MAGDFAIVIPVFNEGPFIIDTIKQIREKVLGQYRIYFIYDFDEDSSIPHIKSVTDPRIVLLKNKYGRGVLNAIKTGFEGTSEDKVVVFMADLSEDPSYINDMVRKSAEGYDIVCGSRYMKGGRQTGAPLLKSFLSRMAGLSLRLLTGIPTHDISNSFKLYSRKILNSIKIESTGGFELGMEIVVKAYLKGYRITEVPVVWNEREKGASKFQLSKWLPKYLYWYFYLLTEKVLRIKH
jgi:glycosyltransferase involved in cell wall biosynthesis